jgi:hypothetical protein
MEARPLGRDDARGILTAMLQDHQPIIEKLIYLCIGDDAYDSAHGSPVEMNVFDQACGQQGLHRAGQ